MIEVTLSITTLYGMQYKKLILILRFAKIAFDSVKLLVLKKK